MTTENIHVTLGYLVKGFFSSPAAKSDDFAFDLRRSFTHFNAEVEAMEMCTERAIDLTIAMDAIKARWPDIDYPGVFDYEVSEPYGEYLFSFEGADSWEKSYVYISNKLADFFLQAGANKDIAISNLVTEAMLAIHGYRKPVVREFTYEVRPCAEEEGQVHECEPSEADYWGVYERHTEEDIYGHKLAVWAADFLREGDARAFAELLGAVK